MRPLFSVLVLAFLLPSCLKLPDKISYEAGAGSSKMVGEPSWKDPLGGQISIESKFVEIDKQSFLSAGIGFSLQGSRYEETSVSGVVRVSYLNIPLLYSYLSKSGFYAEAGLQPGFLLSAKDKYNGNTYDYKDAMKKFEVGLPFGAGYITKDGFGIGGRIIPGLTKNHKDGNSRNLLLMLQLSYRMKGNKKK